MIAGHQVNKPFNLQRWFAALSLATIVLIGTLSGYLLYHFLSAHLLERDARVSMEFIQGVAQLNNPAPYFQGSRQPQDRNQLENFFTYITRMPDVLHATVYDPDQSVIWSSDKDLIGKRFNDNDELRTALTGQLIFTHEHRDDEEPEYEKHERAYLAHDVVDFLESYVPIFDQENRRVIGVVELYKAPQALFNALQEGLWLVISVSVLCGTLLYVILFWIVRRAARLIQHQQQALIESEKLTAIGELTASITHNLRNPLAAIRSSAEVSLSEVDDTAREYVEDIIAEVDRLDQWVRELLTISQTGTGDFETARFEDVVQQALIHFGQRPQKQGVDIIVDLPAGLPAVRANAEALTQVVISLIANALEAMPDGGQITVRAQRINGKQIALKIIDTGQGIPEQQLGELFRPLASTKPGGLGVGLPLARRIMQRYNGNLTVSSQLNQGTTAQLQLPIAAI